jgi:hypothetical protein
MSYRVSVYDAKEKEWFRLWQAGDKTRAVSHALKRSRENPDHLIGVYYAGSGWFDTRPGTKPALYMNGEEVADSDEVIDLDLEARYLYVPHPNEAGSGVEWRPTRKIKGSNWLTIASQLLGRGYNREKNHLVMVRQLDTDIVRFYFEGKEVEPDHAKKWSEGKVQWWENQRTNLIPPGITIYDVGLTHGWIYTALRNSSNLDDMADRVSAVAEDLRKVAVVATNMSDDQRWALSDLQHYLKEWADAQREVNDES